MKFFIFCVLFVSGCSDNNTQNTNLHTYLRQNYFGPKNNSQHKDSNKIDEFIFAKVFNAVEFKHGAHYLLLQNIDSVSNLNEYGLINIQTSEYYYGLGKAYDFGFTTVETQESKLLYSTIKTIPNDHVKLIEYINKKPSLHTKKNSGKRSELDIINIDADKNTVNIKSYHW